MVVDEKLTERVPEVPFTERNDPIQTFLFD